ncbi:MAG TPA: polysaccharide deacetylase family protein [Stellaceae bacterium]|nr:polysaccharide deacetylase family protein [Stellaceae bacterium]
MFGRLEQELSRWAEAGRVATLWWRDDDAVGPTPALNRLLQLAGPVPLALAVIPYPAEPALAQHLAGCATVTVIQHGWRHTNHAIPPAKKIELADQPVAVMLADLGEGRRRLEDLFGTTFRPILTPPWNRIDADLVPLLPSTGFIGLSTSGPRAARLAAGGLGQVNTHVDPVDWHAGRGFREAGAVIEDLVRHLAARRTGRADAAEPTGILTHHLVMDEATERFLADLLTFVAGHPTARWCRIETAIHDALQPPVAPVFRVPA